MGDMGEMTTKKLLRSRERSDCIRRRKRKRPSPSGYTGDSQQLFTVELLFLSYYWPKFFLFCFKPRDYWMTWPSPVSKDVQPFVHGFTPLIVYVALAVGSSLCMLVRAVAAVIAGYKTATSLFTQMHSSIFRAPMSFDATK